MTKADSPAATAPSAAIIIPCHNEAMYLPELLAGLIPQIASQPNWQLVLVNDSSNDATGDIVDAASAAHPNMVTAQHGRHGGPGAARTTAAAVACADHHRAPRWIITTDADVVLPVDWVASWARTLAQGAGAGAPGSR